MRPDYRRRRGYERLVIARGRVFQLSERTEDLDAYIPAVHFHDAGAFL